MLNAFCIHQKTAMNELIVLQMQVPNVLKKLLLNIHFSISFLSKGITMPFNCLENEPLIIFERFNLNLNHKVFNF